MHNKPNSMRLVSLLPSGGLERDGLIDLIVADRRDIYLYPNVGAKRTPVFDLNAKPLKPAWGSGPLVADQFLDWNHDGCTDIVRHYTVRLNDRVGNPYRFGTVRVNVLPEGQRIAHPSGHGDDWFWPRLCDFDRDGKFDVLFGDWWGRVWFHRNLNHEGTKSFDLAGRLLKLTNGEPLTVGPKDKDPTKDFISLQGARTVFAAADFDRDGLNDLVVGDTFGIIRYYRNAGTRGRAAFAPPVVLGNLGIRLMVDATDWNGDGDKDIYLPSPQGSVFLERSFLEHGYARARLLKVETRC